MLETIELETGPNPSAAVIWMHGLGADGNDFVPIVNELDLSGAPAIRFVFPHAPKIPVTINNGYVMRAWYDVSFGDLEGNTKRADEKGVRQSQANRRACSTSNSTGALRVESLTAFSLRTQRWPAIRPTTSTITCPRW